MSEWIQINLPWSISPAFNNPLKYPNLEKRCKTQLGFNKKDLDKLMKLFPNYNDSNYEQADTFFKKVDSLSKAQNLEVLKSSKDPEIKALGHYREQKKLYDDWYEKQPEVKEWFKQYQSVIEENKKRRAEGSFSGQALNKPGTLIEVSTNGELKQYLIGHINTNRGVCDDCCEFEPDALVVRYKVVYTPDY